MLLKFKSTLKKAADGRDPAATFPYCPSLRSRDCSASLSPDPRTCRPDLASRRIPDRPRYSRPWNSFADPVGDSSTREVSYLHCEPYDTIWTWTRGVAEIPEITKDRTCSKRTIKTTLPTVFFSRIKFLTDMCAIQCNTVRV